LRSQQIEFWNNLELACPLNLPPSYTKRYEKREDRKKHGKKRIIETFPMKNFGSPEPFL